MVVQGYPIPRPLSDSDSPRQLHEKFAAAVAETETASVEWWNGGMVLPPPRTVSASR